MYIGNSLVKQEDVQRKYRTIPEYSIADMIDSDVNRSDTVVRYEDYYKRIDDIESDVKKIISTLENQYDLSTALDELKILAEKLY